MKQKITLILLILTSILKSQTFLIEKKIGNITIYEQATNKQERIKQEDSTINTNLIKKSINTIITSEEIERRGYNSLQEVLAKQPLFIDTGSYMGNQVITPVGGNPDQIKIYLNDVLLNVAKGNASAGVDLSRIPTSLIDRIEIKGLSIYVYTKHLNDTTYFEFGYGAYNTIQGKALISRSYSNRLNLTFTADSYYTDGDYKFNLNNPIDNKVYKGNFTNNMQYKFNTSLKIAKEFHDKDIFEVFHNSSFKHSASYYTIPPLSKLDSWFNFTTSIISLSYYYHNSILNTRIQSSYLFDSFVDRPFLEGLYVSDYNSHKIDNMLSFDRVDTINNFTITTLFSIAYIYETLIEKYPSIETNFTSNPNRHTFKLVVAPTIDYYDYNTSTILSITPNLRYEQNNKPYLSYGVDTSLTLFDDYTLYYSFLYDYTIPNFNDLYYNNFSNPDLRAEYYYLHSAGLSISPIEDFIIKTTFNYYDYKDKIIWEKLPTNKGDATAYAINPSISYRPQIDKHLITLSTGYIYQYSVLDEVGVQRLGVPQHQVNFLIGYDLFLNKELTSLSINLSYDYYSIRAITDFYPVKYSPEFHNLSLNIYSLWFDSLITSLHFENLLNQQIILSKYAINEPFQFMFKVGYNFK